MLNKFVFLFSLITILFSSCGKKEAIELVRKSKVTPAASFAKELGLYEGFLGLIPKTLVKELVKEQTVEEWANEFVQLEENRNRKYHWEARHVEGKIYLVGFVNEDGRGMFWEANLSNKVIKYVNSDTALSVKYGMTRLVKDAPFTLIKVNSSKLKDKTKGIEYSFDGEIRNDTDKILYSGEARGRLFIIFTEDKALEKLSGDGFSPSLSRNRPWKPGEIRRVKFSTNPIDPVYKNYVPTSVFVEIELTVQDPLGFYFDGAIESIPVEWKFE